MSWNHATSLERIQERTKNLPVIRVERLTRSMSLDNITMRESRRIFGAHAYVGIANADLLLAALDDEDGVQRLLQRTHLWQRAAVALATDFELDVVHFQGWRVHVLGYHPIDNGAKIAERMTLYGRALEVVTRKAFSPAFDDEVDLRCVAGVDLGETVATRGGTKGDTELIFLGSAANEAAKLADRRYQLAVGHEIANELDETLLDGSDELENGNVRLRIDGGDIEQLSNDAGIEWSLESVRARIEDDIEKLPLDKFNVSAASAKLEFDGLGVSNSKRLLGATIIADIDGFCSYIEQADRDDDKRDAIVTLHQIRSELREVLRSDHDGVRVQYRGDNVIGVLNMPVDDKDAIAQAAVSVAAGMQASMEKTLPQVVQAVQQLSIAVGIDHGDTIGSRLGEYARRNAIVLGYPVSRAERLQRAVDGGQTAITARVRNSLDDNVAALFTKDDATGAYVARDLTADKLELTASVVGFNSSEKARIKPPDGSGAIKVTPAIAVPTGKERDVRPFRPYADDR